MARILLVDDEPLVLKVLSTLLKTEGHEIACAASGEEARALLQQQTFELMMSDIRMDGINGIEVLRYAREHCPKLPVVMLTGYATVESASEALKLAAFDYLRKPIRVDQVLETVERALACTQCLNINDFLRDKDAVYRFDDIVARSAGMQKLCKEIKHIATTFPTVLLVGESGTGRSLIAETIHRHGPKKDKPYQKLNCGELPGPILEIELFGSSPEMPGIEKPGLFMRTRGGVVFLDEIGVLPESLQTRVLEVLRHNRVGMAHAGEEKKTAVDVANADVQVLAGADPNIARRVEDGSFNPDLMKALSMVTITVKPLRERRDDILPLVAHFLLRQFSPATMPVLMPDVPAILLNYAWPGNVRELEHAVVYMTQRLHDHTITRESLPEKVIKGVDLAAIDGGQAFGRGSYWARSLKAFLRESIARRGLHDA